MKKMYAALLAAALLTAGAGWNVQAAPYTPVGGQVDSEEGSVAIGYGSQATDPNSTAIGFRNNATGNNGNNTSVGAWGSATGGNASSFGVSSQANGANSSAFGSHSSAEGQGTAVGYGAHAGYNATAVGNGAQAYGWSSMAQGDGATAHGDTDIAIGSGAESGVEGTPEMGSNTAIGQNATATGGSSTAIGPTATATADHAIALSGAASGKNSVAMGAYSKASAENSVALGVGSVATEDNTVSVGGGDYGDKKIVNMAAGDIAEDSTDAINGSQIYATNSQIGINEDGSFKDITVTDANGGAITNLTDAVNRVDDKVGSGELANKDAANLTEAVNSNYTAIQHQGQQINALSDRVSDLGGEIDNVGAISAALAGLHPLDYDGTGSKFQLAAAMGNYDGTQAAAIGGFYHFNEDVMMSVGGATSFGGDNKSAFNVGVSFRVGQGSSGTKVNSDDVLAQLEAMNEKIAALEAENQSLSEKVAALEAPAPAAE